MAFTTVWPGSARRGSGRGMWFALLGSLILHIAGLGSAQIWGSCLCRDGKVVCPKQCTTPRPRVNVELVEAQKKLPPPPPRRAEPKRPPAPVIVAPPKPKQPLAAPKRGRIVLPEEALKEPAPRPAETTAQLPTLPPELVVPQSQADAPVIATPEVFSRTGSLIPGEPGEYGLGGTGKATGAGPFGTAPEGGGTGVSENAAVPAPPEKEPEPPKRGPTRPPQVLYKTEPPYPPAAKQQGIEGIVLLSVQVKTDGSVGAVRVARSSGHSALDEAAAQDVRRWEFSPALRDGKPVVQIVKVRVTFRIVST